MKKILISALAIIFTTAFVISCTKNSYKAPTTTTASNTVNIYLMQFTPSSMTVAAGTTVTWTNTDNMAHTVTSTTGAFDSGNLPAGNNYTFKFTTKGTFPYKCTIHPGMTGTIIVN